MGKKSRKKGGKGGKAGAPIAANHQPPSADDLASLQSIGPMLESLKRMEHEKAVKGLLQQRTELLKKHIAYLKLHEQVREAVDEAKLTEGSGDTEDQAKYTTLLAQLDGEMAELSKKREQVDSELQGKMRLLGENFASLLGVDDASAPFDSSHFTPEGANKLSSLEGKKRVADLKRQRAVTLQQLQDCGKLFEEVAQEAVATAQKIKGNNAESESGESGPVSSANPAINHKCVTLLARIENEMDELKEKAAEIEKSIEEQSLALVGSGMGVAQAEEEGSENKETQTIYAASPPVPPSTSLLATKTAVEEVDTATAAKAELAADSEGAAEGTAGTGEGEGEGIGAGAEERTGLNGLGNNDDGFSAALEQLDAYDAELRAACSDLIDTKDRLQEVFAESADKEKAEAVAAV
jgi:hypothetical protein